MAQRLRVQPTKAGGGNKKISRSMGVPVVLDHILYPTILGDLSLLIKISQSLLIYLDD